MNPLVFFLILPVAFFTWILWVTLRAGEYRIKSRGPRGETPVTIRRSEQPAVFWTLVALHFGLILYIASIAFSLE